MGRQAEGPRLAWGALWLKAAMLSSCFLLTQPHKIRVTQTPRVALRGQNVKLIPGGRTDFVLCTWYRGRQAETNLVLTYVPAFQPPEVHKGIRYTGRESTGPGCFLLIKKLMVNNTEKYIVTKSVARGPEVGFLNLDVKVKKPGR